MTELILSLFYLFSARGVSYLFDIQVKSFNPVYDGEDVIAQARTGTGKTFSFAIPLVEKLQMESAERTRGRPPKVLTLHFKMAPLKVSQSILASVHIFILFFCRCWF